MERPVDKPLKSLQFINKEAVICSKWRRFDDWTYNADNSV